VVASRLLTQVYYLCIHYRVKGAPRNTGKGLGFQGAARTGRIGEDRS
jgi:hypothetical protein